MKRLLLCLALGAGGLLAGGLTGCRGGVSSKPPIHLIDDMDQQRKFQPEEASKFFADGRAMRPLVEGTVAQGHLDEDDAYFRGKVGANYVAKIPAPLVVDAALVRRGQERYNIYCAACHDRSGLGQGLVVKRGYPIAADLTKPRIVEMSDGQLFEVISQGIRNMPGYRKQIPVEDRWAIIAWVRVLNRAGAATIDDVPSDSRNSIEPEGGLK